MMAFAPPLELLCLPARLAIQKPKNDSADLAPWEWNFDPCPPKMIPQVRAMGVPGGSFGGERGRRREESTERRERGEKKGVDKK
mmetsp:Transcript_2468/g.5687  ORF Transcript_2468/g.5687 Transcript_2468/m.5687 type:complete len:84 (+) Transcript_2468:360-611(+)